MKFSDAKKLVPSPAVLVVLAVIAGAFGLYIAAVQQHTAQLNQRNFYYLSVTERNLESSLSAVSKISRTIDHFMYLNDRSLVDGECGLPGKITENYKSTMVGRLTATNELFTDSEQISVQPTEKKWDWRGAAPSRDEEVRKARFSEVGIEAAWKQYAKAGEDNCDKILLNIEINVPYANIRGIKDHPNYFQSVIIFGGNTNKVYADTADLKSEHSPHGITQNLFQVRTPSAEKLSSLDVIQALYKIKLQNHISATTDKEKISLLENVAFTQSDIVKFEIGDNSYLAFIQPTDLFVDGEPMVLLGLVPESDYRINKYSIDLMSFTYISLVLIGLAALIPIIRLYLFHAEAILRPGDWIQLAVAVPLIATVVLVIAYTILAQQEFKAGFDRTLDIIAENMTENFTEEAHRKFANLHQMADAGKYHSPQTCRDKNRYYTEDSCSAMCLLDNTAAHVTEHIHSYDMMFSGAFDVDQFGRRMGECASALAYPTIKPVDKETDNRKNTRTNLNHRKYVSRILQSSGFYKYPQSTTTRGYIGRVESIVDGVLETTFSIEHPGKKRPRDSIRLIGLPEFDPQVLSVAVGLSTIQSFESAILPFGFEYAVIENSSGEVIFHSDDARSLRENFFQAVNHDDKLISAVLSQTSAFVDSNYNGKPVRARLHDVAETPWTLAVFYETEIIQAQLFHFATTGISMLVLYVLLLLLIILATALFAMGVKKFFPSIAPATFQRYIFWSGKAGTAVPSLAKARPLKLVLPALAFLFLCPFLVELDGSGKFAYLVFFGLLFSGLLLILVLAAFVASRQQVVTPIRYRRDKYFGQGINSHIKEKGRLLTLAALFMGALFFLTALLRVFGPFSDSLSPLVTLCLLVFFDAYLVLKIVPGLLSADSRFAFRIRKSPILRLSLDAAAFFLLCIASYHAHSISDICLVLSFSIVYGASKLLAFTVDIAQQKPRIDRNRGLYELSERGSVVVVFLFLVPFSLLLNENFDLHERSWVNFNNWRDAHTVRDKYVESRNTQRRYFLQEDTPELSSFEYFETWVRRHSKYFYFPNTAVVDKPEKHDDINKEKESSAAYSKSDASSFNDDFYEVPIEDRRAMDLFSTVDKILHHNHYIEIFDPLRKTEHLQKEYQQPRYTHDGLRVEGDHYLSNFFYLIPRFSDIGSLLLQSSVAKNNWLIEWAACERHSDHLCSAIKLPGIDAAFAITQYFPHTRTTDHSAFAVHLVMLTLVSFIVLTLMRISLPMLVPSLTLRSTGEPGNDKENNSTTPFLHKQRDIVMANLAYFGLANPRNTLALDSLLEEQVISEHRMGYEIVDQADIRKAKNRMTKAEMIRVAKIEGQGAWQHVRAPVLLLMFGAVFFAIYAVQDELSSILQIFGSITALLLTTKSIVGNFKNPDA